MLCDPRSGCRFEAGNELGAVRIERFKGLLQRQLGAQGTVGLELEEVVVGQGLNLNGLLGLGVIVVPPQVADGLIRLGRVFEDLRLAAFLEAAGAGSLDQLLARLPLIFTVCAS